MAMSVAVWYCRGVNFFRTFIPQIFCFFLYVFLLSCWQALRTKTASEQEVREYFTTVHKFAHIGAPCSTCRSRNAVHQQHAHRV